MNIEEILTQLKSEDSIFPRKALKEAIRQQEEIIPQLLKILEDANNYTSDLLKREGDMSFLYAMFLLAQFREKLAYPLIVKLVSNSENVVEALLGDVVTEDLCRILASVCGGELELIKELIENPSLYEYVRSAAVKSLTILVVQGELSRDEVINYFRELFQSKLKRDASYIWTSLVVESTNLCSKELETEIKQAFESEQIDTFMISLKNFESSHSRSLNQSLAKLRKNDHYSLVNNTIAEIEWWYCFQENKPKTATVTEEVAPTFSALVQKVTSSEKKSKKSQKKKKGFG